MKQIGAAIVSTIVFCCLLYMIVNISWQTWVRWVTGIFIVLLWMFSVFLAWLWYIIETQIVAGVKSEWNQIKERYGVNSFGEFIITLLQKLYY